MPSEFRQLLMAFEQNPIKTTTAFTCSSQLFFFLVVIKLETEKNENVFLCNFLIPYCTVRNFGPPYIYPFFFLILENKSTLLIAVYLFSVKKVYHIFVGQSLHVHIPTKAKQVREVKKEKEELARNQDSSGNHTHWRACTPSELRCHCSVPVSCQRKQEYNYKKYPNFSNTQEAKLN